MNDLTSHDVHERQNGHGLEHRLRDLADHVAAPASDGTRQVIGRRSRVLRRRRQVRRAAAGGVLVVATVVGAVALRAHPADVELGPADDGRGAGDLPALALDLDGWLVTRADEHEDVADLTVADQAAGGYSVQLFRPEGQLDGPVVYLAHGTASDTVVPSTGEQEVDIRGAQGYVSEANGTVRLRWNPASSDSEAQLAAYGLAKAQVVEFARALVPLDDELEVPARAGTRFGFDAATAPEGIEEVDLPQDPGEPVNVRRSWYQYRGEGNQGTVEIQVDNRGERAFEMGLYDLETLLVWSTNEQVTVLGHPALLRQDATDGRWVLQWRQADDVWVTVTIGSDTNHDGDVDTADDRIDREAVDDIIDGLHEVDEDVWQDMLSVTPPG